MRKTSTSSTGKAAARNRTGRHDGRRTSPTIPATQTGTSGGPSISSTNGHIMIRASAALFSASARPMSSCGQPCVAW